MKIKLLRAPLLRQLSCAECTLILMTTLSEDRKSVTYTHHGAEWVKCSQINTQFSEPIELEAIEVEAEVIPEVFK